MPVTKEHIRGVNRATLKCVRLAFSVYQLFESAPNHLENSELAKKRKDIVNKKGDLELTLFCAVGQGLREHFGVANARAGRAERIQIDGTPLNSYHDYALYLLMALGVSDREFPIDKQNDIERDIVAEAKRALAFLDVARELAPDSLTDGLDAKKVAKLDQAERECLTRVDRLVYEIEGLVEEFRAVRDDVEASPRRSYDETKELLIADDRYLTGGGMTVTSRVNCRAVEPTATTESVGDEKVVTSTPDKLPPGRKCKHQRLPFEGCRCLDLDIVVSIEGLLVKRIEGRGSPKQLTLKDLSLVIGDPNGRRGSMFRWLYEIANNKESNTTYLANTKANQTAISRFNRRFRAVTGVNDLLLRYGGMALRATAGRIVCSSG